MPCKVTVARDVRGSRLLGRVTRNANLQLPSSDRIAGPILTSRYNIVSKSINCNWIISINLNILICFGTNTVSHVPRQLQTHPDPEKLH